MRGHRAREEGADASSQEVILMALVRSDPFREVDRLFQQMWSGQNGGGRSMAMPMDAYRKAESS
jgi:hypothetical protein